METKFYLFKQNNSGGSFDVDDILCHRLFVEANDIDQAISKAEELGCYWDGCDNGIDCACCGDRWHNSPDVIDVSDLKFDGIIFTSVESYAQMLADKYGWTKPDARIFYLDGRVKEIYGR